MKLDSGQVACRRSCRQEKGCWVTKQSFMQLLWHLKIACRRFCRQAGATLSMSLHHVLTRSLESDRLAS